jgi:biopolymer transport protein ExbB/TolQ
MDNLRDIMNHGYGAMWAVVGFSVIAIAVAIERLIAQWRFVERARELSDNVGKALAKGATDDARSACERSPSPMADIYLVGLSRVGKSNPDHLGPAVQRERIRVATMLRTRLWMLGTIGATVPFVGLFGTVVGIMEAMSGFNGDVKLVLGPIAEALIVTAAGILVAVEGVILFNYFSQRAGRIGAEMKLLSDEFVEQLIDMPSASKSKSDDKKDKDS